jgi:predicted aspartyl protease
MMHAEVTLQATPGGSYYLPVMVNRTLSVPFALDTGSEPVQIPLDVYLVLMRNGSISPSDGRGSVTLINADGSSRKAQRFVIHELKVGDRIVTNVLGTVSSPDTTPLLGQSFLRRLGSYTIDNQRHVLKLD